MRLHDPEIEAKILALAEGACADGTIQKADRIWWSRISGSVGSLVIPIGIALFFMGGDGRLTHSTQALIYSLISMALIRAGIDILAKSAQRCGLFSTLANLPVEGRVAFKYVRSQFFRSFWFLAIFPPVFMTWWLGGIGFETNDYLRIPLLIGIILGSVGICGSKLFLRFLTLQLWYIAGSIVAAFLFYLIFSEATADTPSTFQNFVEVIAWTLPPTWVLRENLGHWELLLGLSWCVVGFLAWIRWPSTAMRGFDRAHDFMVPAKDPRAEKDTESDPEPSAPLDFEAMLSGKRKDWLDSLIFKTISVSDRAAAEALLDEGRHRGKLVLLTLVLGPVWLWLCRFETSDLSGGSDFVLIPIILWGVPIAYAATALFPFGNSITRATSPYPLGPGHVPIFSMLPVSIHGLLRISQKVTMIRGLIFCFLATPFFWALAYLREDGEIASGLLGAIPAFSLVCYLSRPLFIWHRIQSASKRKKGVVILHLATSSLEVLLFFLWCAAGLSTVASAYIIASQPFSLIPLAAMVGGTFLTAAFARILLEVAVNEFRHRRCDWACKIG